MTSPEPSGTAPVPDAAAPGPLEPLSPIEATLRILQSSVPHLIGSAVVRIGPGAGTVAGQIGRVPWLFDRRLTALQLSDDALPPNRAVLLDWPVPHQAEWIGVPPRLLIARLAVSERTVGVLLGTLLTREQLDAKTRESIELSCQLIASAEATEALVRESEQQARRLRVLNDLQRALSSTLDARALGRVLREAMNEVVEHIGFSVSLFHPQRDEIAYRYRVVDPDVLSRDANGPIDDGPASRAAREATRIVFAREVDVELGSGKTLRRQLSVVQFPLLVEGAPIGIVTVQAFRPDGFSEDELGLAQVVADTSANYFAHARRVGLRRPAPEEPKFTLVTGSGPVTPDAGAPRADASTTPPAREPMLPSSAQRDVDRILRELLGHVAAAAGHALVLLADDRAGLLRGHLTSASPFMAELDTATGITRGTFLIGVDDRSNAVARACREGRVVSVGWLHEIVQPTLQWQDALVLERLAGGGHCSVLPLMVAGRAAGAVVAGPTAADLPRAELARLETVAARAAAELAVVWADARARGESFAPGVPEENVLRLSALRDLGEA